MIQYLQKSASANADGNGLAMAVLRPDTGQFWAPSLVTVATLLTPQDNAFADFNGPTNETSAYCGLYRGQVTPLYNNISINPPDTFSYIDDTFNGSGDATSIMSGTIIQFGEALTARWNGASSNEGCLMTVYGRSSDSLVELQEALSPIPGTRFSGNGGGQVLWNYEVDLQAGPDAMALGTFAATQFNNGPAVAQFKPLGELVSVKVTVTTNATVANRFIGLRAWGTDAISGAQINVFNVWSNVAQTATQIITYHFVPGVLAQKVGGVVTPGDITVPIPPNINLANLVVTIDRSQNVNGGDMWSNWQVVYRRLNTISKAMLT